MRSKETKSEAIFTSILRCDPACMRRLFYVRHLGLVPRGCATPLNHRGISLEIVV
jgi:hypothetical protein